MPYRVGDAVFAGWESVEVDPGQFADVFIYPISYAAGLMPGDYTQAIRNIIPTVNRLRRGHSAIWIKLESPEALWFYRELRRGLKGLTIPIAVTIGDRKPTLNDFSYRPYTDSVQQRLAPPWVEPVPRQGLTDESLACLRVLARLGDAFTTEVISLTGLERVIVEESLKQLQDKKMIDHVVPGADSERKYPYWKVQKTGKSLALRSWGVPPGFVFTKYREIMAAPEGNHRRKSRLWPSWLRFCWPQKATIYAGWTEASLAKMKTRPDGLCWGQLESMETLFWLEVESGHASRSDIQDKIYRRMKVATSYSAEMKVNLVFCVLGMRWVAETATLAFAGLAKPWTAVVIGNWSEFGTLPIPQWGQVQTQFGAPD
jgi:hypothetical protein